MKISIDKIAVPENRFRKDATDIDDLVESIPRVGLIQPIVVSIEGDTISLVCGERRLNAFKALGLTEIYCIERKDVDEVLAKEIELEENLSRKDMPWQDVVNARAELVELKRKQNPSQQDQQTAKSVGIAKTTMSEALFLDRMMKSFPELRKLDTKKHAMRLAKEKREKLIRQLAIERGLIPTSSSMIKHGDCTEVMRGMDAESVHLVITDPPFGIDVDLSWAFARNTPREVYDDSQGTGRIAQALPEMFRVMVPGAHLYLFYAPSTYAEIQKALFDAGFEVIVIPMIWLKNNSSWRAMGGQYSSIYEAIMFAKKPGALRQLHVGSGNVFQYDVIQGKDKIHPSQKPIGLLRKFIEESSEPGETVLDPFSGSGSTIKAAVECGRNGIGIELDEVTAAKSIEWLGE